MRVQKENIARNAIPAVEDWPSARSTAGAAIKLVRRVEGFSCRELAIRAGIHQKVAEAIETRSKLPNFGEFLALSKAMSFMPTGLMRIAQLINQSRVCKNPKTKISLRNISVTRRRHAS
jgi:hypothetical protein